MFYWFYCTFNSLYCVKCYIVLTFSSIYIINTLHLIKWMVYLLVSYRPGVSASIIIILMFLSCKYPSLSSCNLCITINILHCIVRFFYLVVIFYHLKFIIIVSLRLTVTLQDGKGYFINTSFSIDEALWFWDHLTLTGYCIEYFSL
jgi:hypothetical protein